MTFKITQKAIKTASITMLYGEGGCGKSFLAAMTNQPLFVGLEKGVEMVNALKFETENEFGVTVVDIPNTAKRLGEMINYVVAEYVSIGCKTVVIDSAKFIDILLKNHVTETSDKITKDGKTITPRTLEECDGGFMRGDARFYSLWEAMIVKLDSLCQRGINVVLIAHAEKRKHVDTDGNEYYRIEPDLHASMGGKYSVGALLCARCDNVLFIESLAVTKTAKGYRGKDVQKVVNTGDYDVDSPEVIVHTRKTNRFYAKVRAENYRSVEDRYVVDFDDNELSSKVFVDIGI